MANIARAKTQRQGMGWGVEWNEQHTVRRRAGWSMGSGCILDAKEGAPGSVPAGLGGEVAASEALTGKGQEATF